MSRVASTTPPEGALIPDRHPLSPATGTQIPSHFKHCFGCGELHPTGLHFTAVAGVGQTLNGKFLVTENHQGAPGLAHGGLLTLAFDEALGLTGLIITKLDGTAKGGVLAAIAQSQLSRRKSQPGKPNVSAPVVYIGVGEGIDDLQPFRANEYVSALLSGR